jgi:hypothetical protein
MPCVIGGWPTNRRISEYPPQFGTQNGTNWAALAAAPNKTRSGRSLRTGGGGLSGAGQAAPTFRYLVDADMPSAISAGRLTAYAELRFAWDVVHWSDSTAELDAKLDATLAGAYVLWQPCCGYCFRSATWRQSLAIYSRT